MVSVLKSAACAAAMVAVVGCSEMQKFGLGSATATATEHAAATVIEEQTNGGARAQQAAGYDSGAGRQIGQAAGQEAFSKVPYLGGTIGGVVGQQTEKAIRSGGQQQHPDQPPAAPAK
jgi:hypothetical protein